MTFPVRMGFETIEAPLQLAPVDSDLAEFLAAQNRPLERLRRALRRFFS